MRNGKVPCNGQIPNNLNINNSAHSPEGHPEMLMRSHTARSSIIMLRTESNWNWVDLCMGSCKRVLVVVVGVSSVLPFCSKCVILCAFNFRRGRPANKQVMHEERRAAALGNSPIEFA